MLHLKSFHTSENAIFADVGLPWQRFSPCHPLASPGVTLLLCAVTDTGNSAILFPLSTPHLYEQRISKLPQA